MIRPSARRPRNDGWRHDGASVRSAPAGEPASRPSCSRVSFLSHRERHRRPCAPSFQTAAPRDRLSSGSVVGTPAQRRVLDRPSPAGTNYCGRSRRGRRKIGTGERWCVSDAPLAAQGRAAQPRPSVLAALSSPSHHAGTTVAPDRFGHAAAPTAPDGCRIRWRDDRCSSISFASLRERVRPWWNGPVNTSLFSSLRSAAGPWGDRPSGAGDVGKLSYSADSVAAHTIP